MSGGISRSYAMAGRAVPRGAGVIVHRGSAMTSRVVACSATTAKKGQSIILRTAPHAGFLAQLSTWYGSGHIHICQEPID